MSAIAAIAIGTVAVGGTAAYLQSQAAGKAASTQAGVAREGMAAQERQLEEINALMKPYVDAGYGALTGLEPYAAAGAPALQRQQALAGTLGAQAQQDAIELINSSPIFRAQITEGENALLQNASATGGLRGGNVQAALARFRPAMLNAEIERQYGRLGGLTQLGAQTELNVAQLGQAGAARQAAAGLQTAANIGNLGGQMGAAQAGGILGQAGAYNNFLSGAIPQAAGTAFMLNRSGLFGGASAPPPIGPQLGTEQIYGSAAEVGPFQAPAGSGF
jgi:hypothetical protein